ncbi:MAG: NAD-binding protein, partial [Myxococcota bacterium]
LADATDQSFWDRVGEGRVEFVLLAMDQHAANLYAARQIREVSASAQRELHVAATVRYDDEAAELEQAGADAVFNLFAQAGAGFAAHVEGMLERRGQRR